MNKFSTIVLFLLIPFTVSAGNMTDTYKQHIPSILLNDRKMIKQIEEDLQTFGELDPDIIYYYLSHLQLRYDSSITNPDSNLATFLKAKISKTQRLKKNWARISLYIMADKFDYTVRTREISAFYNKFKRVQIPLEYADNHKPVDTNLLFFYKYLFMTKEESAYDPSVDYQDLYINSISDLIEFFESTYLNPPEHKYLNNQALIQKAFDYSYVFKESYLRNFPKQSNIYLFELVHKLLENKYKTDNWINLFFPMEVISQERMKIYKFNDPMNYTNRYYYKFNIQRSAYANLGFLFKMKGELNPGSHIRFSIGYSIYQQASTTFSDTTFFSGSRHVPGLYFEGDYIFSDPRDINTFAITSEFTFPVLYFSKDFFLEAGLHYKYQRTEFTFDFTKPGTLEQPFSNEPQPFFDDEVVHMNRSYHIFRPSISLNYILLKQATLRMDYIFPTNMRLAVVMSYGI